MYFFVHFLRSNTEILCSLCIYFIPKKDGNNEHGKRKLFPHQDVVYNYFLVTGDLKVEDISYKYCSAARKFNHMCGESGKKYVSAVIFEEEDL